jgi:hypothetical protein
METNLRSQQITAQGSGMIDHPAFSTNTVLPTEPINELYQMVRQIVFVRETGCCFTAHSGFGKTKALAMVEHLLRQRMPELLVIRHNTWNHQVTSIRAFYKHFLTAIGHQELRGETFDLRHRLMRRLVDMARANKSSIVLLLIDEANALRLDDFLFLKDVYNELDRDGIQLITVMMGQEPDFGEVLAVLRERGRQDLISRFARRHVAFRAFSTEKDFKGVFRQYDTAVFPLESGQTWTQYFLPNAWENGFRLGDQVGSFLQAVERCASPSSRAIGIPARQLFTVIRRFLLEQMYRDESKEPFAGNAWDTVLAYAMLDEALAAAGAEEKRRRRKP